GQLDLVFLAQVLEALVVVIDRYRKDALGLLLADHILAEQLKDLMRGWQIGLGSVDRFDTGSFIPDDVVAQVYAFIADEYRRAGNEFLDLMLALAAKRTIEQLFAAGGLF